MKKCVAFLVCVACVVASSGKAFSLMPLVTDEAGTIGRGRVQIETGVEITSDKRSVTSQDAQRTIAQKESGGSITMTGTVGLHERLDFILGIPYQWFSVREEGNRIDRADGLSDISLSLKWQCFEQDGLSFAVKPGISLPTGDDGRGLGIGKATYQVLLIGTKALPPWAFHINLGYIRNENKVDERENLWHVSAAAQWEIAKDIIAVANVGIERNADESSNTNPAFMLTGLVYRISESVSVDCGLKIGITRPETDVTYLLGMTVIF